MRILIKLISRFIFLGSIVSNSYLVYDNLRKISLSELFFFIKIKIMKKVKTRINSYSYFESDEKFIKKFNCQNNKELISRFENNLKEKFFFNPLDKDNISNIYKKKYKENINDIINSSNDTCNHNFNILGSGKINFGKQLDWHLDFKSGHQWNKNEKFTSFEKLISLQDSSDIKIPLELSRFQHLVTLGKAYWLADSEKHAKEFVDEIENWIENNPVGFGVNWSIPMDVAIRVINWIWGYCFFMNSKNLTNGFKLKFLKNLFLHGKYIFNNLEVGWVRGNHFISDLTGLIFLGIFVPKSKESTRWFKFGKRMLFKEIEYQIHKDGVDFEASIGYHRLVTEMILSDVILLKKNSIEIPKNILEKLEKMIEFIMYYTKPDGKCPIIGDNDNGRLHNLANNDINDHRYLLSIGAVLFNRKDFKGFYKEFNEEAFWLLGARGLKTFEKIPSQQKIVTSKDFRDAGYYIMRKDNLYMNIRCGDVGLAGHGGHGHCDCLSFELFAKDKTFIIDPGTYVYTADKNMRNLFRSTKYHNTLVVDGKEINRFKKDKISELFAMNFDAVPKLNTWEVTDKYDVFDGEHDGYHRLEHPVTHRRRIQFNKKGQHWIITDILTGKGKHLFEWYFHFAPIPLEQNKKNPLLIRTKCKGINIEIVPLNMHDRFCCEVLEGWISYSYGTKEKAPILRYELNKNLDEKDLIIEFKIMLSGRT